MERTLSATEARVHFGELLDAVQRGETVIVERGGKARAVVIPIAEYKRRPETTEDKWARANAMLAEYHQRLIADGSVEGLKDFDVEEAIRVGRDDHNDWLNQ